MMLFYKYNNLHPFHNNLHVNFILSNYNGHYDNEGHMGGSKYDSNEMVFLFFKEIPD
jgi:hypothetical protein